MPSQLHCGRTGKPIKSLPVLVAVPMLKQAPQLEPRTLLLHGKQTFPDQELYRRKRTMLQRRVEQWQACAWH